MIHSSSETTSTSPATISPFSTYSRLSEATSDGQFHPLSSAHSNETEPSILLLSHMNAHRAFPRSHRSPLFISAESLTHIDRTLIAAPYRSTRSRRLQFRLPRTPTAPDRSAPYPPHVLSYHRSPRRGRSRRRRARVRVAALGALVCTPYGLGGERGLDGVDAGDYCVVF